MEDYHTQLKQVEFTTNANFLVSPSHGVVHSLSSAGRHGCFAQGPESTSNLRRKVWKKIQRRDTTKFKHIKSREWRHMKTYQAFSTCQVLQLVFLLEVIAKKTNSPHLNPTPLPSCFQPRLWQILPVESLGNAWLWEGKKLAELKYENRKLPQFSLETWQLLGFIEQSSR